MAVQFLAVVVSILLLFPGHAGREAARAVKEFKKEMDK